MEKIEILGTGCAKCRRLEKNVEKAVADVNELKEILQG
ncbi:MAG: thioredoxin family protein [Methanogenium sp.]|nr:thioredoxin family protein [Methanogenium sp.]